METLKRRSDILERKVGEEHMLYDATGRKVHVLNETAYFVWGLCDGSFTLDAMAEKAAEDFNAPAEELRADIEECIQEFKALALLQ